MNLNQIKQLKQFEQVFDSELEILYEGVLEGFAYYFSRLDIEGMDKLLSEYNNYDGVSKDHYLNLITNTINDLKSKGINSLMAVPGICNGCIKGCNGFSFIDNKTGVYVDIIVEVKHKEITNFMECYELNNDKPIENKKERIVIKQTKIP
ncbi:hypothetical protein [uncultured Lutibacter sp.]|uniref:hypothetical protein n=1 Tax=uncultured Lutibacter sp. TaxID=437739 RepID=UPI00261B0F9E|nr:hypothetical protein [uncultured Lutibacter sp.]